MIWVLGVLAYLAVGAVVVRVLGRFEMFEDMVGFGNDYEDRFELTYRGMAVLMWLPFAAVGLLLGGLWLLGRLSGAKGP